MFFYCKQLQSAILQAAELCSDYWANSYTGWAKKNCAKFFLQ